MRKTSDQDGGFCGSLAQYRFFFKEDTQNFRSSRFK
jgi:hypothetical protein